MFKFLIDKAMRAEVAELHAMISKINGRIDSLMTNMNSLRGFVNRGKKKQESSAELTNEEKEFLAGVPFLESQIQSIRAQEGLNTNDDAIDDGSQENWADDPESLSGRQDETWSTGKSKT